MATAPIAHPEVKTLGLIASSYLFVLRARTSKAAERAEYRDKFAKLAKEPAFAGSSGATELWRELWQKELDYLVELDRCGALKVCTERARKRVLPAGALDEKAGPEVAKLVRRGTLPSGSLNLTFAFGAAGLEDRAGQPGPPHARSARRVGLPPELQSMRICLQETTLSYIVRL